MKKNVIRVLVVIYIVIAVLTTFSLLTYNNLHISEFNKKSFVKLTEDVNNFKKGSLVILDKPESYVASDNVLYCVLKKEKCVVTYGKVDTVMSGAPMINNQIISESMVIGKVDNARVIPAIGYIMNFLESRWGYLCFVVLPVLVGFIYELRVVLKESKK